VECCLTHNSRIIDSPPNLSGFVFKSLGQEIRSLRLVFFFFVLKKEAMSAFRVFAIGWLVRKLQQRCCASNSRRMSALWICHDLCAGPVRRHAGVERTCAGRTQLNHLGPKQLSWTVISAGGVFSMFRNAILQTRKDDGEKKYLSSRNKTNHFYLSLGPWFPKKKTGQTPWPWAISCRFA